MPKTLTEQKLNEVKYVSIADYMAKMDQLESFEDKMAFTTRYLLSYGAGENSDVSFEEAVHFAKIKIADVSAKLREEKGIMNPDEAVDPYLDDNADEPNRLFMIDPIQYLKNENYRLLTNEANDGVSLESQARMEKYQLMSAVFSNDYEGAISNRISALDIEPTQRDFMARLKSKYVGNEGLDKAIEKTKPGVLAKAFGKYSKAYANLDQVYQSFNNPGHVLYGDLNALDKAATEYLQHVFPSWNPKNGMINKQAINALSGTRKERALLSLNILETSKQQRKGEEVYETIKNANLQRRAEKEAGVDSFDQELPSNSNAQFQENIAKDLLEDEVYDQEQAEKEYAANFIAGPEDEVENDGIEP